MLHRNKIGAVHTPPRPWFSTNWGYLVQLYSVNVSFRISRIFFQRCNKWPEPTLRWTAIAREGRRCRRAWHTQPVREDPVKIGHSTGAQHQVKCYQVCADARSAVTFADCCSLHLSSRARCIFQPRTHHVGSQHGRSLVHLYAVVVGDLTELQPMKQLKRHDRPRWPEATSICCRCAFEPGSLHHHLVSLA